MLGLDRRRRLAIWRIVFVGVALWLIEVPQAWAHQGPPFPLFMDRSAGSYVVSVWADPDIGEAAFYIVVESPAGGTPPTAPNVSMWVEPVSGRLDRVTYQAKRQSLRNQMQFEAKPHFDQRDRWAVGFQLAGSDGEPEELFVEVESTPPGMGPWDFAIYLFPFLLLAGLWVAAIRRRRCLRWQQESVASARDALRRDQVFSATEE